MIVDLNSVFMEELNRFLEEEHPGEGPIQRSSPASWKFRDVTRRMAEIREWQGDVEQKFFWGDGNGWPGHEPMTRRVWREEPERFEPTASDVVEVVGQLGEIARSTGGEMHLVTARQGVNGAIRERLGEMGLLEIFDGLRFEREKHELSFDVYIDDYPYLYRELERSVQLMVDRSWNRGENPVEPHRRIESVEEAPEVIRDL